MKFYNSLTRQLEEFEPLKYPHVGMYACGPTVYSFVTIGNFRTFTMSDTIVRSLKYLGYEVDFVMNLTDVGHLTGDNQGDADQGEDRLQKSAEKEGKNAYEVAQFYTDAFLKEYDLLNLTRPKVFAKATDHILSQINLILRLEDKGLTYKTSDGVYFDTVTYEQSTGKKYGELSSLDKIMEGARVEPNPEKKNARDFALWKFSYTGGRNFDPKIDSEGSRRHMEWKSPWGLGFPGWHIECSAMSMEFLGESFDIHAGGEDLRATHHPNEIAQSEGATGKQFSKYWIHSSFLKVDGKRMGKSLGNAYSVSDIVAKGFDPLALRYFYLTAQYRSSLNFTWEGLTGASQALLKLKTAFASLSHKGEATREILSTEKLEKVTHYEEQFKAALSDDFNTPQALAVTWEVLKSNIPSPDKVDLLKSFDEVLGLKLGEKPEEVQTPEEVITLLNARDNARASQNFEQADQLRQQIEKKGYTVVDAPQGARLVKAHVHIKD